MNLPRTAAVRHSTLATRHSPRGAIMVITLLAIILLAAMVFYVINLGRATNARVVAQHAADSTAASGAGWVARTFNTVAMNNTGIARTIANVALLDAMPMVCQFTHEDQLAALQALDGQLQRGVSDWYVRDALLELRPVLQREVQTLAPMDALFNGQYDVQRMTYYSGPGGQGLMWRAMAAMDDLSQAAMENLPVLAQVSAMGGGEVNLERDRSGEQQQNLAVMVPLLPQVQWKRGRFDDFERPVRQGLLPVGTDDKTTNRGPWDTVNGWRFGRIEAVQGYDPGGNEPDDSHLGGGTPDVPFGSGRHRPQTGPGFIVTGVQWKNYGVYGPFDWSLARFDDFADNHLYLSRIAWWLRTIARIKLDYCWPGTQTRTVGDPEWITDFSEAANIGDSEPSKVRQTAYFRVEVKSRYPRTDSRFGQAGTWVYDHGAQNEHNHDATIVRATGWHDARRWDDASPQVSKVDDYIWRDEWFYYAYSDAELGLPPAVDAQGDRVIYTVYRIDSYIFLGIDIGPDVEVGNPFNFTSKQDLPAPIDFDHAAVKPDEQTRRELLTFLTAARRTHQSSFWPSYFEADKPDNGIVALAEVEVFNNHSWDLWTQMWHAQLRPIEDYDGWLAKVEDAVDDAEQVPGLSATDVADLATYLANIRELAPVMLAH